MEDGVVRKKPNRNLESGTARLKLSARKEPFWTKLGSGLAMGYYRPKGEIAGTWSARFYDARTRKKFLHSLGAADDYDQADDRDVLSYDQAQVKAHAWFAEMRATARGEVHRSGPLTVQQAWEAYAEDAERRGMKGLSGTRITAEAHILPAFGAIQVIDLTQGMIETWHLKLAKKPARVRAKKGAEVAYRKPPATEEEKLARRSTANRVLAVLKALLNFAKRKGLTRGSAEAWREAQAFEEVESSRLRFLTPAEAQRLVNVCARDFRLLVQGALFTGARFGELAGLTVSDFEAALGKIRIAPSKMSRKARYAVLTEEGQGFFQSITAGRPGDEPLFLRTSNETRNFRSPKVRRAWRKSEQAREMILACEAAKIEPLVFHELRHTHASGLINNGVPLAFVAAQLGHTSTRMVEKHYGHLAPSAMADSIRTLAPKLGIHQDSKVLPLLTKKGQGA
jgi:integrase